MKNVKQILSVVSLLAIATIARAELAEAFEDYQDWTWVGKASFTGYSPYSWVGMAHVEDVTNKVTSKTGYPIPDSKDNPHMKTICALGSVTAENVVPEKATGYSQVEYLQQVTVTVDTLVTGDLEDVQIALSTGKPTEDDPNFVDLWLYCLPKGSNDVAWVKVGKAQLGSYMRVNLAFDYANQTCRVSVDGIPCMSEYGFLLPEAERADDTTTPGAWYYIGTKAYNDRKEHVATVQLMGLNVKWDDVKVTEEVFDTHAPFAADPSLRVDLNTLNIKKGAETPHWMNVSLNDLNRWAIDDDVDISTICLDKSGHTVKEKLELGYDPLDGKRFAPTDMYMSETSEGNEKVRLTFPKAKNDADLRYSIIATGTYDDGQSYRDIFPAEKGSLNEDSMTATSELPPDIPRVLHFQLRAERVENEPEPESTPVLEK